MPSVTGEIRVHFFRVMAPKSPDLKAQSTIK